MKKPVRKAGSMGLNRTALSSAKFKTANKIMDTAFDTKGLRADAGKSKLGGLYKGAKLSGWNLFSESNKLHRESEINKKAGRRMAKAQAMQKSNKAKLKQK